MAERMGKLAIRRQEAQVVLERLLKDMLKEPRPFRTQDSSDVYKFNVNGELRFRLQKVEITDQGTLRAYIHADCFLTFVRFEFDINRVHKPGRIRWVCLKKVFGVCVFGFFLYVPKLPSISFTIKAMEHLGTLIPAGSASVVVTVKSLRAEKPDGDKLELKARVDPIDPARFKPDIGTSSAHINRALFQVVNHRLDKWGLGDLLRHVSGFVQKIVDEISKALGDVGEWTNFMWNQLLSEVVDQIHKVVDLPDHKRLKVGRVKRVFKMAPAENTPRCPNKPPVNLQLESAELSFNTACDAGPELVVDIRAEE